MEEKEKIKLKEFLKEKKLPYGSEAIKILDIFIYSNTHIPEDFILSMFNRSEEDNIKNILIDIKWKKYIDSYKHLGIKVWNMPKDIKETLKSIIES